MVPAQEACLPQAWKEVSYLIRGMVQCASQIEICTASCERLLHISL